jgi:16S rRNA processing protein RimM
MTQNQITNYPNPSLMLAGKISTPYGLNGMVKVISYMQSPADIFCYTIFDNQNQEVPIAIKKEVSKNCFIVKINAIDNRTMAEQLGKIELFIDKDQLPPLAEDEFYASSLKQLPVVNVTGKTIGKIIAVHNFGAGDIIEITFNNGSSQMYAFNSQTFPQINEQVVFIPPKVI